MMNYDTVDAKQKNSTHHIKTSFSNHVGGQNSVLLQEFNLMGNVNCTAPEEVFHSKFSSLHFA